MHKNQYNTSPNVDEENPYWISFSDLMAALLIIFILASIALIIELTQIKENIEQDIEQLKDAEQARQDILVDILNELKKHNIFVEIADNHSVLRIPESTLSFESNSYDLPKDPRSKKAIKLIGLALHKAINTPFDANQQSLMRYEYLDTVFIEGHTDSWPTKKTKGNWGLSSFRAISLWENWQFGLKVSPKLIDMENAFGQKLFSVSGYAATRRIELEEKTPQQRKLNRRIDIRFTVKKPSILKIKSILNK